MISDAFGLSAGRIRPDRRERSRAQDAIEAVVAAGVMSGCMSDRFA